MDNRRSQTITDEVISALFTSAEDAQAALAELRDLDIAPNSISVITRDEDQARTSGPAGVMREEVAEEGLTYRASSELPNDEDLPTTAASLTGSDMPVVTDFEVPPDEPLGGSDRLGLHRDAGRVQRMEASTNADADIYTDFPGEPGGVNPDSPAAAAQEATVQAEMANRTQQASTAAIGAGIGSVGGLLLGLAALAIPGVGPFLAAGPLAVALGSVVAGGVAGGVIGAISSVGVPEEYAREYAASIQQGSTLISVRTDAEMREVIERIFTANHGQNIH